MINTQVISSKDARFDMMINMAAEALKPENLRIVVRGAENRKERIESIRKYGLDFYIAGSAAEATVFKGSYTAEDLATACRNTIECARIQPLQSALFGGKPQTIDEWSPKIGDDCMYVLTNDTSCNGAGVMFCDELLDEIQTKLDCDYYILPSSVHELIIIPDEGGHDRDELENMVRTINVSVVDPADRLSDHVYYYSGGKLA